MKEKTYNVLLVVLAILLAVSIFLNGWFLCGKSSVKQVPENLAECACEEQCADPSCIQQCTSICMITILNNEVKNQASRLQQNIDKINDIQSQVKDAMETQQRLIESNSGKVPTGNDPGVSDYNEAQKKIDQLNTEIQQMSSANQQMQIELQQNINAISTQYDAWSDMLEKQHKTQQELIESLR